MTKNAYIHIPFCKSKCNYCSFVSFTDLSLKEPYLKALKTQIKSEYKGGKLNTLYFGGGTPSLLSIDEIKELTSLFDFEKDAEITFEINPDSVNYEYLKELRQLGVNRLSIGVQTFNYKILQLIGRRHTAEQALFALECALDAGFENISIDLIYGLPSQGVKDFEADLKQAVKLNIRHISLYGLKIEEGCEFYKHLPENTANSDIQADMYLKALEVLTQNGFEHYEVSNFAINLHVMLNSFQHLICERLCDPETSSGQRIRSDFKSKHNLNYWNNNTYYGFGCAASGYAEDYPSPPAPLPQGARVAMRYTNEVDLQKYIQNPLSKISQHELSEQEILEEAIFLGLRKIAGINVNEINQRFNIDFNQKYTKILEKYSEFFIKTQIGWALNTNGLLISNEILSEFID